MPISFWPWKSNGQWSVPTTCRSPLRRPIQRSSWWSFGRSGGEQTNLAPSNPLPEVVQREVQVLRAGLAECHGAAIAGGHQRLERVARGHVDEVDRHAGDLGQADHSVGRLALEAGIAREAVADRISDPCRDLVGRQDVDDRAVLGVHQDHAAVLPGLLHRPEDVVVGAQEDTRVRREELEVRDALCDQLVHLGQRRVVHVRHDHVEAVVDERVALGLRHPGVETRAQAPALRLHGEVDDRGRPTEGGRAAAGLEGVLGERATER